MPVSSRKIVRLTSASLLIGFAALMAIVATNFWLGQRAQSYFDNAIEARDTRIAAVELRNAMQTAEACCGHASCQCHRPLLSCPFCLCLCATRS